MRGRCKAELIVGLLVFFLHEQGAGKLKPDPEQTWIAIEDAAESCLGGPIIPMGIVGHPLDELALDDRVEPGRRLRCRDRRRRSANQRQGQQAGRSQTHHGEVRALGTMLPDEGVLHQCASGGILQ